MALNELETLFIRAFTHPGVRPSFYRLLMRSDLWVLAVSQEVAVPPLIVTFMRSDGVQVVPCFTSEDALARNGPVVMNEPSVPQAVRMRSRLLMEVTRGLHLHLNPKSEFSRDFTPQEIARLLKDETIHYGTRIPDVLPAGIDIQLKSLDIPQPALEAALAEVFCGSPEVGRAFLVEAERIRNGELVRTLMMVAEARPSTVLTNALSCVFSDVYDFSLSVDLCFDEGNKDVVDTLLRIGVQPFYVGAVGRC